jgi:hypothetical protein
MNTTARTRTGRPGQGAPETPRPRPARPSPLRDVPSGRPESRPESRQAPARQEGARQEGARQANPRQANPRQKAARQANPRQKAAGEVDPRQRATRQANPRQRTARQAEPRSAPNPPGRGRQAAAQPDPARPGQQRTATQGRRSSRTPFILFVIGLLASGLVCLLVINTTLAAGSFQISKLQEENTAATQRLAQLQQQVSTEQSPGSIEQRAQRLGMRMQPVLNYLDLRNGRRYSTATHLPSNYNVPGYTP